jgi:hypothetical protein
MVIGRHRVVGSVALLCAVIVVGSAGSSAAQDQVTVPTTVGQTITVTWQGTVLPGANASSECGQPTDVGADAHAIDINVPAGTYDQVSVQGIAAISYDGPNDLILTVVLADGSTVSSDSGSCDSDESAAISNPPGGTMQIIACMFAGAVPQPYTGTLTLTAAARPAPAPASCGAPGKALQFSGPSHVDVTRAGGEPSVEVHPNGTLLYAAHAGTTHFYTPAVNDPSSGAFAQNYRGQVYAWYSGHLVLRRPQPATRQRAGIGLLGPRFRDRRGRHHLSLRDQPGERRRLEIDGRGTHLPAPELLRADDHRSTVEGRGATEHRLHRR